MSLEAFRGECRVLQCFLLRAPCHSIQEFEFLAFLVHKKKPDRSQRIPLSLAKGYRAPFILAAASVGTFE